MTDRLDLDAWEAAALAAVMDSEPPLPDLAELGRLERPAGATVGSTVSPRQGPIRLDAGVRTGAWVLPPEARRLRARIAATLRHHPDADVSGLRTELTASHLVAEVTRYSSLLNSEQRTRIAAALNPVSTTHGGTT